MTEQRKKPKDEFENPLKKLIVPLPKDEEFEENERQFKREMMTRLFSESD
jgi:hypothetical protein